MGSDTQFSAFGTEIDYAELAADAQTQSGCIPVNFLSYTAAIQGTWVIALDAAAFGGVTLNTSPTYADADEMTFKQFLGPGTYKIRGIFYKNTPMAIVEIQVDGVARLSVDCYNAGEQYNIEEVGSNFVIATGSLVTISVKANGKNGSSSNYYMKLHGLSIVRVS